MIPGGHAKRVNAWRVTLTYSGRPQSMILAREGEAVRDLFWLGLVLVRVSKAGASVINTV
jgi:hypothetical protein